MRVGIFVNSFPVVSETFVLREITGLIEQGHEIDLYAEHRPEADPVHAEVDRYGLLARTTYMDDHIPAASGYWEMPVWPLTDRTWLPGAVRPVSNMKRAAGAIPALCRCLANAPHVTTAVLDPHQYGYQALSLSALYRMSTLCSRHAQYEILHAHFGPVGNTFRFARRLFRAPFVVSFHGYDASTVPAQEGVGIYSRLFDTADAIVVNSECMRRRLVELGCPPSNLHILRYGLQISDYPFHPRVLAGGEPVKLLTVARLVEKKGLAHSIRAVAHVLATYPNLRYDIVGEGPLRGALERLIASLGLSGIVTLHGARDSDQVRTMMEQAHLFILGSVTAADGDQEGTPVSLLEAQACGLPVLSTDHAGIPEIVLPGRSGVLVPEGDEARLAGALADLLAHPEAWPWMGREGRALVETSHDRDRQVRRLVSLYDQLVQAEATRHV